jgi:hypothetical protein
MYLGAGERTESQSKQTGHQTAEHVAARPSDATFTLLPSLREGIFLESSREDCHGCDIDRGAGNPAVYVCFC